MIQCRQASFSDVSKGNSTSPSKRRELHTRATVTSQKIRIFSNNTVRISNITVFNSVMSQKLLDQMQGNENLCSELFYVPSVKIKFGIVVKKIRRGYVLYAFLITNYESCVLCPLLGSSQHKFCMVLFKARTHFYLNFQHTRKLIRDMQLLSSTNENTFDLDSMTTVSYSRANRADKTHSSCQKRSSVTACHFALVAICLMFSL